MFVNEFLECPPDAMIEITSLMFQSTVLKSAPFWFALFLEIEGNHLVGPHFSDKPF